MDIYSRAKADLSLSYFKSADNFVMQVPAMEIKPPKDQYILRMMVKSPWSDGFKIPPELEWLRNTIVTLGNARQYFFDTPDHPFVYVTVRSGEVKSVTDDLWHVDGFSMRVAHRPEQNYIWTDVNPTEVLLQKFDIPVDFDPFKHNLHKYFQDNGREELTMTLRPKHLALIDPYIVHRRPQIPLGTQRCFFRISFIPIEIEDDTCMQNPLLPSKIYNREDIRNTLIPYGSTLQNK